MRINKIKKNNIIENSIDIGLEFYLKNLFDNNMLPNYYTDKIYPIDIHSFAVSMLVLLESGNKALSKKIYNNAKNLLYSNNGYFYFRKTPFWVNRIPYMRWSNAWMFYAMTEMEKYENMD